MKPAIAPTTPIWGIHADKTGDAASLFLSKSCATRCWNLMKIEPVLSEIDIQP